MWNIYSCAPLLPGPWCKEWSGVIYRCNSCRPAGSRESSLLGRGRGWKAWPLEKKKKAPPRPWLTNVWRVTSHSVSAMPWGSPPEEGLLPHAPSSGAFTKVESFAHYALPCWHSYWSPGLVAEISLGQLTDLLEKIAQHEVEWWPRAFNDSIQPCTLNVVRLPMAALCVCKD